MCRPADSPAPWPLNVKFGPSANPVDLPSSSNSRAASGESATTLNPPSTAWAVLGDVIFGAGLARVNDAAMPLPSQPVSVQSWTLAACVPFGYSQDAKVTCALPSTTDTGFRGFRRRRTAPVTQGTRPTGCRRRDQCDAEGRS